MTQPFNNSSSQEERQQMLVEEMALRANPAKLDEGQLRYLFSWLSNRVRQIEGSGAELDRFESRRLVLERELDRRHPKPFRAHDPRLGTTYHQLQNVGDELEAQVGADRPAKEYPRAAFPEGGFRSGDEPPEPTINAEEMFWVEPAGTPVEVRASMANTALVPPSPGVAVDAPVIAGPLSSRANPSATSLNETSSGAGPRPVHSTIQRLRRLR
jgi:hypothetical protein